MRSFIGLDLTADDKIALDTWRQQALPEIMPRKQLPAAPSNTPALPYAVPATNFHITLAFLGDISARQHDNLMLELDAIALEPFTVTLNSTGIWDGPKILFAAPTEPPAPLLALAKAARKAARTAGIALEKQTYRPHITLVRKATSALPPPLFPPELTLAFDCFHLFESVSGTSGVQYPTRESWSLRPELSTRELLRRGLL